ncbi:GIY-YIG nuclease family protein [Alphaproteobacteria bacterium]|nr:GIY-YIG nuclease family protein [Alphaproteobacteria bacterium]
MIASINNSNQRTYVGWTHDIEARLLRHNSGTGAKATRGRKWVVIFTEAFKTRGEAMKAEYALKHNRPRRQALMAQFLKHQSDS